MKSFRLIVVGTLIVTAATSAGNSRNAVAIELRHRTADEMIPIIRPFLETGDTLSGSGYMLILNTGTENLARIQSIIANLDKAIRQLMIMVVQGNGAKAVMAHVDVSGHISVGKHARIEFGRNPQPQDTVSVAGRSGRSAANEVDIQKVLVQEGMAATIYIGQSIPIPAHRSGPKMSVEYRRVLTGVRVVARLSGDHFNLQVSSRKESIDGVTSSSVGTQQIQTQIKGRLNEWIDIGGLFEVGQHREKGLVYGHEDHRADRQPVFLKMVETP